MNYFQWRTILAFALVIANEPAIFRHFKFSGPVLSILIFRSVLAYKNILESILRLQRNIVSSIKRTTIVKL